MTLSYDLYWSFRSPYSYMVVPRLMALEAEYDVACNVRPVYPLAVRTPEFFETRDPLWTPYFMTDVFREAAFLGLPFRWPRPDPVQQAPGVGYRMPQPYPPAHPPGRGGGGAGPGPRVPERGQPHDLERRGRQLAGRRPLGPRRRARRPGLCRAQRRGGR